MHYYNDNYYSLIKNLPDGFAYHQVVYDDRGEPVDYIFLEVNDAFEEMTGLAHHEVISRRVTEVLPEITGSLFDWIKEYGKLASEGGSMRFEQYSEPLGRYYEVSAFSNEPGYFATIFRDITSRKNDALTKEMLSKLAGKTFDFSKEENHYQIFTDDLLLLSGASFVAFNSYENKSAKSITRAVSGSKDGIELANNLLGSDLVGLEWEFIPERLRNIEGGKLASFNGLYEASSGAVSEEVVSSIEEMLELGEVFVIQVRYDNEAVGDFIFFMPRGKTIANRENIEMYVNQVGTILSRARAEASLRENEEKYRSIIQAAKSVSLIVTDLSSIIKEFSPGAEYMLGYSREEVIGKHVGFLHEESEAQGFPEDVKRLFENQVGFSRETRLIRKNGEVFSALFSLEPFFDSQGNMVGTLGISIDISERKQMEEELKTLAEDYEKVFNGTQDAMFLIEVEEGGNFRFIRNNHAHEQATGLKKEEIQGKTPVELLGEEMGKKVEENYRLCVEKAKPITYEETLNLPVGERLWLTTLTPVFQEERIAYLVGSGHDVTERKKTQEKVHQLSERLKLATNSARIGVWDLDLLQGTLIWDELMFSLYGIEPTSDFIVDFEFWNKKLHPRDRERVLEEVETALRETTHFDTEFRIIWPDESIRYLKAFATVQYNQQGKAVRMVGVNWDITERKEVEEDLRTFRAALDNSADHIFIIDPHTMQFLDANARACEEMGYRRDELLTMGPQNIKPYYTKEELFKEFQATIYDRERATVLETIHKRKDGSEFPVEISLEVFMREETPLLVASVRDITERRQAEEELARHAIEMEVKNIELENARNAALEASQAKSEFLSTMSHEIRTPMNSIIGMAELLAETSLTSEQQEYVRIFRNAGENLLSLINDILDISKIESGYLELNYSEFNLVDLVEKTVELMSMRASEKGLELACRIQPELKEYVLGDPDRLRQVLVNLLSNAIKFTDQGDVVLRVQQGEQEASGDEEINYENMINIFFAVEDTGVGIPKDKQEAIFDEFTQVDSSSTRSYGGTGLGLAISRRLVNKMGGELRVDSTPGEGSTFYFTIPFQPATQKPQVTLQDRNKLNLEGIKILIVDDNDNNRLILREILMPLGSILEEAENGNEAMQKLRNASPKGAPFDLVLLDAMMPEKDGFQVAAEITEELPELDIIMLSSAMESQQIAQKQSLKIDAFINKPVRRQILLDTMAGCLKDSNKLGVNKEKLPPLQNEKFIIPEEAREEEKVDLNIRQDQHLESLWQPPGGEASSQSGYQILLVEDNIDNRMLVEAYLKKTEHRLDIAENGEEAVHKVMGNSYDLVLMDMQMPVKDGYTATKEIREWEKENEKEPLSIIALTAYALEGEVKKALDAGCDAHVPKPVKKNTLLEAIEYYASPNKG